MTKPTTLYRFYDIDRRLLYVGISIRPWQRFLEHRTLKAWWQDAESIRLEHFATRGEAVRAELHAIKTELPLFNIQGQQISGPWDEEFEVLVRAEPNLRPIIEQAMESRYCPWEYNLGFGDELRALAAEVLGPKRRRPTYLSEHAGEAVLMKDSLEPFLAGWEAEMERSGVVSTIEVMLRDPSTLDWFALVVEFFLKRPCGHEHHPEDWTASEWAADALPKPWWVSP